MFVIMEYFTRWVVVAPLPITDSEKPASVLLFEVVFKFGTPRRLIADNGSSGSLEEKAYNVKGADTPIGHLKVAAQTMARILS